MTVDKSPERIQKIFNTIAKKYDFLNHLLSLGMDRCWRRQTVRRATPKGDGPILDVCTGTADFAAAYAKRYPERQIFGLDFSSEMIAVGRQRIKRTKLESQVTLMEGDALRLPFETDMFALVSVSYGIRNTSDPVQALAEMVRVCKPGGVVAILEFSMPEHGIFAFFYRFYFRHILPRVGAFFSGERLGAYRHLHESVQTFPQGPKLVQMMENSGLKNIQQFPMTFGTVTLSTGEKVENGDSGEKPERSSS